MTYEFWIDVVGWIGSLEVITAYYLISTNKITAKNIYYQILNATGAIFLILNTIYYGSYPTTLINIVWLVIAGIAIIKMILNRNSDS